MRYTSVLDAQFDTTVTLAEAYRVMYRFLEDIEQRGPVDLAWVLYAYADVTPAGTTIDPAAADDFIDAARAVLPGRVPEG